MDKMVYEYWSKKDLMDKGIVKQPPVYEWVINSDGDKILKLINQSNICTK